MAAVEGASFVGLNPLHATTHRRDRFCPYQPVSRLYRDSLYLDPERVPELEACRPAQRRLESDAFRARLARLREAPQLDSQAAESIQLELLRPLYQTFRDGAGEIAELRRRAFRSWRKAQGATLNGFTRFQTLADHFEAQSGDRDWRHWPAAYRDAGSEAVDEFAGQHGDALAFHAWIQFELDRQLAEVAREARDAGLALGLCTDLAIGSAAGGSDTWSRPEIFAHGASVGAPPDAFAREGQDWGFPPLDPRALRQEGFAYFRQLLDANLRHAGALRLDHALGLRRLFWIPEGARPSEGAYVRQPEAQMMVELSEASVRHQALVIAEDLGTVPAGFSEEIQARGLLSTRVLLFERDAQGFRPAADYPSACLASANTHDLPPLAALTGASDIELRWRVGQIRDPATFEALRAQRSRDREALLDRLNEEGGLTRGNESIDAIAAAITAFLCATPARLVALMLDDLGGEEEPINLPGVPPDRHSSWSRRMRVGLEDLFATRRARAILEAVPRERRPPMGGRPTSKRRPL
ncbi:MAG: 4-alpha-glucanotransferase [Deltaproteobacteria bacterium]|jgi:4-alpha-glucanotransferase|nr:4-alpha-glucanotransferase [Deltaproteobacteria bacterium]